MSYTQLAPQPVIDACNSYIEARKVRIQRECEELISGSVGYRGWFGFGKPVTREQAEAEWAEEIGLIKITGGMWAGRVRELLSLATVAEKSNTLVTLDADISHVLRSHFG
jgi:hypothetical protein